LGGATIPWGGKNIKELEKGRERRWSGPVLFLLFLLQLLGIKNLSWAAGGIYIWK
jgi:hypothetical protein